MENNTATPSPRNGDDIASDYANATSDEHRAALIREMDAFNAQLADEHLRDGNIPAYQAVIGRTHQAHRQVTADSQRVIARMQKGNL